MVINLSTFMRYSLMHSEKEMVSFARELDNIKLYLSIEKVRFGRKLNAEFEIDPVCLEAEIPNMILQPLFENAIKYGVYETTDQVIIKTTCTCEGNAIKISILNDYDASSIKRKGEGIGLRNIRKRMEIIYNQPDLIKITDRKTCFEVQLVIPQKTSSVMSEKLQTIIIEDEELARNLLRSYLKDHPDIEIIGECENGFDGVKAINDKKPDLVFLDIQMPKITGFEMIELLDFKPQIIFTTAYDQYALKAFELNAIDYLLKPFSKERLLNAVEKVKHRIQNEEDNSEKLEELTNLRPGEDFIDRVVVKDRHKIHIITVDQIRYIESLDDYVMIYTYDGRHMKQKTMKYFENNLDPKDFIRIHRSYIVQVDNIAEIQQYEKESYIVILKDKDKTKLKVSKTGYKKIKEVLHF